MSLTVRDNGESFEIAPAGSYIARCFKIIDLGTQTSDFNGEKKSQAKILIGWELPTELDSHGKPFSVMKRYTASLNQKASLRKDLEAWRGRSFTDEELNAFYMGKILGTYCMLNIIHVERQGKTFTNVASLMPLPKGVTPPAGVNQSVYFDFDMYDANLFNELSEGLKKVIMESPEWKSLNDQLYSESTEPVTSEEILNPEEIPF